MSSKLFASIGFVSFLLVAPASATITQAITPFANNDFVNWSQLGADGVAIPGSFSANSNGLLAISGSFAGPNGGTVLAIPGSWPATSGSLNSGDSLIWTGDSVGNNNGPLTLSFPALIEAGLWIQADRSGAFTAQIQVFEGAASSTFTATSAGGNPVFLGGTDSLGTALITKVVVSLTSCGGGTCTSAQLNDFAVDTLFLETAASGVPEPGTLMLLGTGLLGLGWGVRRRSLKARRTV